MRRSEAPCVSAEQTCGFWTWLRKAVDHLKQLEEKSAHHQACPERNGFIDGGAGNVISGILACGAAVRQVCEITGCVIGLATDRRR